MARKLLDTGLFSVLTSGAAIGVGWKLNIYTAGTSTRANSYNAPSGGAANTNPVIADASGRFDEMWLETGASYKWVLTDESDVVKVTVDNFAVSADAPTVSAGLLTFLAGSAALPVANGGTGATTAADAAANLSVLKLSGGEVTGDITRDSAGGHLYHTTAAMNSGRVFLTTSAAADPTSLAGDVWLKY